MSNFYEFLRGFTPVLEPLQVLHSIALDVEGAGNDVNEANGKAGKSRDDTKLATEANVAHHALQDQEKASAASLAASCHGFSDAFVSSALHRSI